MSEGKQTKKWMIGASTPFECLNEEHFELYRKAGIDAFELSVDAEYYNQLDFHKIKEMAEKNGITLWSFHLPFYYLPYVIIDVVDEEYRKKVVEFQSQL